jgi:hypothetical protein
MNKLTKIGLSALCGSLASISAANAGSMAVTGSATATYTTLDGQVTGNPLGMATGLTFTGSGELDGGQTFDVVITHANKNAWSTAGITLNTNSVGTFKLSSAEGSGGIGGYDDNMPRAWEEVWDTGIATNANFQKGVGSSMNLNWTSPKFAGSTIKVAYSPDNDGTQNNNKGVSGSASDHFAEGWDIVLDIDAQGDNAGINVFIGASETEIVKEGVHINKVARDGNHQEAVVGLQLTFGPLQAGAQVSAERMRAIGLNTPEYYGNGSFGVAFNVNDNLSVSYSEARHVQSNTHRSVNIRSSRSNAADATNINEYTPKSWMHGKSYQMTYTIGGIGIKYAETDYDNTGFANIASAAKAPKQSKIVALSLAF